MEIRRRNAVPEQALHFLQTLLCQHSLNIFFKTDIKCRSNIEYGWIKYKPHSETYNSQSALGVEGVDGK